MVQKVSEFPEQPMYIFVLKFTHLQSKNREKQGKMGIEMEV